MHLKPKKRLGQNFLVDQNIQRKIISSLDLGPSDIILEIGAGRGELTKLIAQKVKKVYAVEIDKELCTILRDTLSGYPNTEIINTDILKLNLDKHFRNTSHKIKAVGNIPYYISTPIIERLFKFRKKISSVFLTLQKEFACRMIACAGLREYGSFSCFVQYYSCPKIIFTIKKACFYPAPKVDSVFLRLNIKEKTALSLSREKELFRIIRAAFNQRRKTLRNSLSNIISSHKLDSFFSKYAIDSNIRPQGLSLQDFTRLLEA